MSVQELEQIQTNKVMYFCNQLGINDYSRAERYLNAANWDEKLAVQNFRETHPNHIPNFQNNNPNFYPQNQPNFQPQLPPPSQISIRNRAHLPNNEAKENYLEFHIGDALYNDKNYNQEINNIKKGIKSVETDCKSFLNLLKNKPGIIIILNKESSNIIKEQIKIINENNESKNIIQSSVIFPIMNNSLIGNELIQQFSIISFPCYIFCKYKNDRSFYLTDRMEGAFDINFFIKYLRNNQSQSKSNNNLNQKTQLNLNNKKNENNKNSLINNLKKEHFNLGKIPQRGQKIDKNNIIKNNNLNRNNNNLNQNVEDQKINENLNRYIPPYNNNNINERYQEDNMGDFFLGDSTEMVNLFKDKSNNNLNNNNNNMNNKFLNPILNNMPNDISSSQNENNALADSIYQLSDGQVLQKRENDMKKLEEEQEKKEKAELEEKNRIQKLNKQYDKEAEMAKMILSKEPDESDPDVCNIVFILPDGENRKERRFLKTEKVSALYNYIKSIGREIFTEPDTFDFDILNSDFPPKNLQDKKIQTLEEEGMFPNSILKIREK